MLLRVTSSQWRDKRYDFIASQLAITSSGVHLFKSSQTPSVSKIFELENPPPPAQSMLRLGAFSWQSTIAPAVTASGTSVFKTSWLMISSVVRVAAR